ncbi:glycoside hydrolase [Cellvibrio sp.]|uniref:glycoside hydrolase n=1 Tax=Cellvibrio sp. TaxID=1965322 RepID=UPI003964851F
MPFNGKMKVVFLWHMHQPDYRNIMTGEYYFPWTYLHALKDYVDMVAHLEAQPKARAVFNFAPILLEQLDDYAQQIENFFKRQEKIKDAVLWSLVDSHLPLAGTPEFIALSKKYLRANRQRMIERFPIYRELADIAEKLDEHSPIAKYLNEQFLIDLGFWYHLSWLSETLRRSDYRVQAWQNKGRGFSWQDRMDLVKLIGEEIASIGPRYKALYQKGQIELCMSPYAHPIVPLLLDINSARQAWPEVTLPIATNYAGGEERAKWHLAQGIKTFEHYFGHKPRGCWPSEGSVSDDTLKLMQEAGFDWVATGDSVLHNTLRHPDNKVIADDLSERKACLHRPYNFADHKVNCFFRDDGLSDLIGFKYATWHSDDAVGDLINHMVNIANACDNPKNSVISVIMDGENAWEYFPENAYYFLAQLYKRIDEHPMLELTTYSELLDQQKPEPLTMPHVVAGSWVYGNFSTWIGDKDKNRGWDMLCEAKLAVDHALATKKYTKSELQQIEKQLALCEGSDWFWWFGGYNPAQSVSDFEYLYRQHLKNLYHLIRVPEPEYLNTVISVGGGDPATGGVMRQGHEN